MMKTVSVKAGDIKREWHTIDASEEVLGKLATRAANLLMGKHKPLFSRNADVGDFVVVTNAAKIQVTGNKTGQKLYHSHSGYPHGLKTICSRGNRSATTGNGGGCEIVRISAAGYQLVSLDSGRNSDDEGSSGNQLVCPPDLSHLAPFLVVGSLCGLFGCYCLLFRGLGRGHIYRGRAGDAGFWGWICLGVVMWVFVLFLLHIPFAPCWNLR